jgi:hypothetical protein
MIDDGQRANEERVAKLRSNSLRRLARKSNLQLRHSDSGYSLIDSIRGHVEGRRDMTLDEVERYLTQHRRSSLSD